MYKNKALTYLFVVTIPILSLGLFAFRHAHVFGAYGTHLSNFALSIFIVFTAGSIVVLRHKPLYRVAVIAGILILANIAVESFVRYMNTPDLTDGLFGIAGVAVACGLLAYVKSRVDLRS